ncbi:MAG: elongation factor P-like protein YeiP [Desulfobacterales bacterium]|nr:elongation factor P-like protein YeiP [Desulfobacterales bacterium]
MIKACNLQKGNVVRINNRICQVKQIEVQTPAARGGSTLYKVRFAIIPEGQKLDQTFKGNDSLEPLELERRQVSFLYQDQDMYIFMDTENYEQYSLAEQHLEGQVPWIVDGLEGVTALLLEGQIIAVDLPATIDVEIVETAPAIKGATATNRNKPATLTNGETVMIPEYLETGETVRVSPSTGKFMGRVKEKKG